MLGLGVWGDGVCRSCNENRGSRHCSRSTGSSKDVDGASGSHSTVEVLGSGSTDPGGGSSSSSTSNSNSSSLCCCCCGCCCSTVAVAAAAAAVVVVVVVVVGSSCYSR